MSGILWPAEAAGWLVLAASLALFAGIAVLGAAAAPGPRLRAADPVAGLGFAAGLLTLLGSATRLPLSLWYGALAALMLAAGLWLWRRRRPVATAGLPLAVLLILPLLGIAAAAPATLWDDFMHWLLNAAYLYRFDSFPHAELPRSPSVWPA
ncbi:MAG TPA: hypothetical protein VEH84_19535, partial [Alphaproteobacteria bacterium]|nr:hypothetical protein [Alphaproteobacteria bacterium]